MSVLCRPASNSYFSLLRTKQPKAKKNMILHTHVPLSMLLTSFYTYKKPPTKQLMATKTTAAAYLGTPSHAVTISAPTTMTGKALEDADREAVASNEGKKDEDVKKPVKPDEPPAKPIDEPSKPAEEPVEPDKPADQAEEPIEQPEKPAEKPEKPAKGKGEDKDTKAVPTSGTPPPAPPIPPRVPPRNQKPRSDVTDLAILVKKILSVSEKVARVVSELKKQEGSYSRQASVSTPGAETAPASFDFYMKAMKPLQFGKSVKRLKYQTFLSFHSNIILLSFECSSCHKINVLQARPFCTCTLYIPEFSSIFSMPKSGLVPKPLPSMQKELVT